MVLKELINSRAVLDPTPREDRLKSPRSIKLENSTAIKLENSTTNSTGNFEGGRPV